MTRFAQNTTVSVERSQAELVALLRKHGAASHAFGMSGSVAQVLFELGGRRVRFELGVPQAGDFAKKMPSQVAHKSLGQRDAWCRTQAEQAERQRWRALILVVKAKLELVAEGMGTVESEFLAQIVLPNGRLVGQWLAPQIAAAYESGKMPPLLPAAGGG